MTTDTRARRAKHMDGVADRTGFCPGRQPVERQAAFVIAVLSDPAE
jgi:hypothetical protein